MDSLWVMRVRIRFLRLWRRILRIRSASCRMRLWRRSRRKTRLQKKMRMMEMMMESLKRVTIFMNRVILMVISGIFRICGRVPGVYGDCMRDDEYGFVLACAGGEGKSISQSRVCYLAFTVAVCGLVSLLHSWSGN